MPFYWTSPRHGESYAYISRDDAIENAIWNARIQSGNKPMRGCQTTSEENQLLWRSLEKAGWKIIEREIF